MIRKFFSFFLAIALLINSAGAIRAEANASLDNQELLRKIQRDTFQYFLEQTNTETGLTNDASRKNVPASTAATGFALASFAIGSSHGWISYRDAFKRISTALDTLEERAENKNGFFYHFVDSQTGKRAWGSEISSIDTALLMAGALLASTYFPGTEIQSRIQRLYERVEWEWMLNGTNQFSHGWKPNQGFLPYYWDQYAEHLILLFLALGSKTHPVSEDVWLAWKREKEKYKDMEIIYSYTGSLFTYQYSHAFVDFRQLNDREINYFENSKKATIANHAFSLDNQTEFKTYSTLWGLSASLGPDGYRPYGALPGVAFHDGTIAPYALVSAIMFTPDEALPTIRTLYENYGSRIYGHYGFKGAINLDRNWQADEYLGIDQGITILMLENYLNHESIWKRFMMLPFVERAVQRAHLKS